MVRAGDKILKKHDIRPRKWLGQNFLVDKNVLRKIIAAARLTSNDNVLEVGPGTGILTQELVRRAKKVVAVEKDKRLAGTGRDLSLLIERQNYKLQIVSGDILKVETSDLRNWFNGEPYKIVANLPYNITSRFLRKFLETNYQPFEMVLMVQKEVAERITAKPGQMSLLAVSVQFFSEPEILFYVSKNCFRPAPKVDSAVIRLNNIRRAKFDVNAEKFFAVVKKGFGAKRKQLKNNLGLPADELVVLGLKPTVRPQELAISDWVKLADIKVMDSTRVRRCSP